ncbi:MAG TPA: response regulator [Smithella sp.]|nr:response regulator [Smithella sp.]
MTHKILIVDDEKDIIELISYHMEKEGFSVAKACDGELALQIIKTQKPDLIILDLMLPKMSGLDVCRNVRCNPSTAALPIIMLTAKGDELDKIIGLEVGADDYVTKPFSVRELIARVRSVLRRLKESEKTPDTEEFVHKGLKINYTFCLVSVDGKAVTLSPTELKLLFFLSRHPGRVYSRNQIIDHVWGDETFITDRAVDVHIRRLRSQIEKDMENPYYIQTVRGFGYKFVDTQ